MTTVQEARSRLEYARTFGVYAAVVAAERALLEAIERENGVVVEPEVVPEPVPEKKRLTAEQVRQLRAEHPEWFGGG